MFFNNSKQCFALFLLFLATVVSFFLVQNQNYQLYILPLVIVALFVFLNKTEFKLLLLCLFVWFAIEVWVFPIRFFDLGSGNFILSQLKNDKEDLGVRALERQLKKNNSRFTVINQNLNKNAETFLQKRSGSSFLVTGNMDWLKLVFQNEPRFIKTAKFENLKAESDYLILNSKFALALTPGPLDLPREPLDLTAGLLANMSIALSSDSLSLQQRAFAAARARNLYGYWKSGLGRSWAFFTEATLELIDSRMSKEVCDSIKRKFAAAASLATSKNQPPEFLSYVYNNAAVARIICEQDFKTAQKLLKKGDILAKNKRIKKILQINSDQVRNF